MLLPVQPIHDTMGGDGGCGGAGAGGPAVRTLSLCGWLLPCWGAAREVPAPVPPSARLLPWLVLGLQAAWLPLLGSAAAARRCCGIWSMAEVRCISWRLALGGWLDEGKGGPARSSRLAGRTTGLPPLLGPSLASPLAGVPGKDGSSWLPALNSPPAMRA